MKNRILFIPCFALAVILTFLPSVQAQRVLFISVDGMRPDGVDALGPEKAPGFYRLRTEGAYTSNARTDATHTNTLPNHTCMVTGRGVKGDDGHNWTVNTDPKKGQNLHVNRGGYTASMFDVAHDHGLSTALYTAKSKFSLYEISYDDTSGAPDAVGEDNGRDKLDTFVVEKNAEKLTDALLKQFTTQAAGLTMLHYKDCDSAGHGKKWSLELDSPYMDALKNVDEQINRILTAIDSTPALKGSTWVVVTADHGGTLGTKGHSWIKPYKENFTIGFYVWGPKVPAGKDLYELNLKSRQSPEENKNPAYSADGQPIRNGDAGNFCLSLLGLPAIPGSTINVKQDLVANQK